MTAPRFSRAKVAHDELLKTFDARGDHRKTDGSVSSTTTQKQVARDAGFSKHQQVQAVRVANVPQEEFDELGRANLRSKD